MKQNKLRRGRSVYSPQMWQVKFKESRIFFGNAKRDCCNEDRSVVVSTTTTPSWVKILSDLGGGGGAVSHSHYSKLGNL